MPALSPGFLQPLTILETLEHLPRYRMPGNGVIRTHSQNSGGGVGNGCNQLIELKSWNRKCGVIRPRCEQERFAQGRITPAVAVVIDHQ